MAKRRPCAYTVLPRSSMDSKRNPLFPFKLPFSSDGGLRMRTPHLSESPLACLQTTSSYPCYRTSDGLHEHGPSRVYPVCQIVPHTILTVVGVNSTFGAHPTHKSLNNGDSFNTLRSLFDPATPK